VVVVGILVRRMQGYTSSHRTHRRDRRKLLVWKRETKIKCKWGAYDCRVVAVVLVDDVRERRGRGERKR
jgi:hypothetical protein